MPLFYWMTARRRTHLSGVQPPFGYPTLLAEAERIRKRG